MKRLIIMTASVIALFATGSLPVSVGTPFAMSTASAQTGAEQSATFKIENMTCALCPVTVKSAMSRVAGVKTVQVDFDAKTATVVFDPTVTDIKTIAGASTNAGYPATAGS